MSRRAALLTVAVIVAIGIALIALTFSSSEPTYKGVTIHEWLRGTNSERREALLVIGTNNLPLLVHRLGYDPDTDRAMAPYRWLERQHHSITRKIDALLNHPAVRNFESGNDAQEVLEILGPAAAPAIPGLMQVAKDKSVIPSSRALSVLDSIGDNGWRAIIALAQGTNHDLASQALWRLRSHTNSPIVSEALTNALSNPDPYIRDQAHAILTNRPNTFD